MSYAPDFIPRLRPEVGIVAGPRAARITDGTSGFGVEVDGGAARLVEAIDGRRSVRELSESLAAQGVAAGVEDVGRVIGLLDSMYLLDNERGRARALAAQARPRVAAASGLRVVPGARWDCHACGYCCSNGQRFGPIGEADRARVLAHDWSGLVPGPARPEDLFFEVPDDAGGPPRIYLQQRGGRCVFLDAENLCAIHRRLGPEAKPQICRMFPYAAVATPEGTFVSIRRECKSLHLSIENGTEVATRIPEIERLVAETPPLPDVEGVASVGALVQWTSTVAIPFEVAAAVRAAALRRIEAPGAPHERALLAVRDIVWEVARRLGDRPGEPELEAARTFAEACAASDAPRPLEAVPDQARSQALRALASILAEVSDAAAKNYFYLRAECDRGPLRLAMIEADVAAKLTLLARLAPHLGAAPPGLPPFDADRLAAIATLDPAAETAFREAARHEVHGWLVATCQPLLYGFAILPFRYVIAKWIALRRAAARGAAALTGEDAHEGVLLATQTVSAPAANRALTRDPRRLLAFFRGLEFGVI
jgi:Fe-S-cluster containining protein